MTRDVTNEKEAVRPSHDHPFYNCKTCRDTGWNHGAQPGPKPGYKTIKCTFCNYWGAQPRLRRLRNG